MIRSPQDTSIQLPEKINCSRSDDSASGDHTTTKLRGHRAVAGERGHCYAEAVAGGLHRCAEQDRRGDRSRSAGDGREPRRHLADGRVYVTD